MPTHQPDPVLHPAPAYCPPPPAPLDYRLASADFLIVDKPAGLLSVPGRGADKADCLLARVRVDYPDAELVHRLDMATSGLIVFARGAAMQRSLAWLFAQRRVGKTYVAVVDGLWRMAPTGSIDLPLGADWSNRPRQKVDFVQGKPSRTDYRVCACDPHTATTRLELAPVTGRSHQLRVHLAALGYPILGDTLYGTPQSEAKAARLLLHASAIAFADPQSGRQVCRVSPPPF